MSDHKNIKKLSDELSDTEKQAVVFLDQWTKLAGARDIHVDEIRKHFSHLGCESPDQTASILESYGILMTKATGKIRRYIVLDSKSTSQRSVALSALSDRFFEITGIAHVLNNPSPESECVGRLALERKQAWLRVSGVKQNTFPQRPSHGWQYLAHG